VVNVYKTIVTVVDVKTATQQGLMFMNQRSHTGLPFHIRRLTEPPRMLVQQGQVVLEWIKGLFPVESDEKNRPEGDELEKWKHER
jgi:hypothetical protein